MTGCPYGAKNSLDYNYLYLAERMGVAVQAQTRALRITPLDGGGYAVATRGPQGAGTVSARKVVLAAGVAGTLDLLFRCRDEHRTLPEVSQTLGACVRTNSESIVAVLHPPGEDLSEGTGISSDFYPDANTHVTMNRFVKNFSSMRFQFGPFSSHTDPRVRALKTLLGFVLQAPTVFANWFARDWEKRVTILTVMQDLDNQLRLTLKRRWWWPFSRGLQSETIPGRAAPSYIPAANAVARTLAEVSGGRPLNNIMESLFGVSVTAHVLSGCPMGSSAENAVLDTDHQVHGYPGLYVVDGASIPANIGVNPSLTIAAMAERFAERQPSATQD
ncbi:MAG: GMC oxidoreductase [Halioglobus sp.]